MLIAKFMIIFRLNLFFSTFCNFCLYSLFKNSLFVSRLKKCKFDNQKVEIGSFLNEEEIEELITLLKQKVRDLNFS